MHDFSNPLIINLIAASPINHAQHGRNPGQLCLSRRGAAAPLLLLQPHLELMLALQHVRAEVVEEVGGHRVMPLVLLHGVVPNRPCEEEPVLVLPAVEVLEALGVPEAPLHLLQRDGTDGLGHVLDELWPRVPADLAKVLLGGRPELLDRVQLCDGQVVAVVVCVRVVVVGGGSGKQHTQSHAGTHTASAMRTWASRTAALATRTRAASSAHARGQSPRPSPCPRQRALSVCSAHVPGWHQREMTVGLGKLAQWTRVRLRGGAARADRSTGPAGAWGETWR